MANHREPDDDENEPRVRRAADRGRSRARVQHGNDALQGQVRVPNGFFSFKTPLPLSTCLLKTDRAKTRQLETRVHDSG